MSEQEAGAAADSKTAEVTQHEEDRYLLFRLNGELFATPLLGVREVVEPHEPKPIPNTPSHFLGMINIRGRIVGVVDLRATYGYPLNQSTNNALMVFETAAGPVAAVVDAVEEVVKIDTQSIEHDARVKTSIPSGEVNGIAHLAEHLVTLVDLNSILGKLSLGR